MANRLFVISGPSGAGKGTVIARVRQARPDLALSVSATTRSPRPGEVDGVSYHFMTDAQFDELAGKGGFLEWAHVHDHRYGTPRMHVEQMLEHSSLILEIDPQGAFNVRAAMPEAVLVFVAPPSMDVLRQRLEGRGTEDAAELEKRLADAASFMEASKRYDEVVVNDVLDETVKRMLAIIERYESC